MGNCVPHFFDSCLSCVRIFVPHAGYKSTINCACFDSQAVNSENEEEITKEDETIKKGKKKKRVAFAKEIQK
jgi:hypothetical protein